MINIIILYHESVIQKICRKNDIFLCHFPTYYFTIYNNENWYDKSVKDLLGNIIKVANNATRLSTGETTSKCNIYDMGGNVAEFTTEVMPNTSEPVVVRGGHYNTNGLAGRRLDYSTSIAYDYVGFRVTLFLN